MSETRQKLAALSLSGLAIVALVASVLALGVAPVAANHSGNTTTEIVEDQNVTVTDDDRSVYVEAGNITYNGSQGTLYVHVYGIENGSETQVANGTLSAGANSTDLYEASVNASNYSEYRVEVRAQNGTTYEEFAVGTISKVSGGGGGFVSGSGTGMKLLGIPVALIALVAGGYALARRD
jgi:hypothetical protein